MKGHLAALFDEAIVVTPDIHSASGLSEVRIQVAVPRRLPSNRHSSGRGFEELDPLCEGYTRIFSKAIPPLGRAPRSLGVL